MKTIIWDFNGTIIDDTRLCFEIEMKMLEERNMPNDFTLEWYRDHFTFPVIDYYYLLGYDFLNESYDDIAIEFNELYSRGFSSCNLVDGFLDKINESIQKGYQNVIVSASHEANLIHQCKELNIENYFEELIGIDNLLAGSKIDRAKKWMEDAGIDASECKYIGDTLHDKDTAESLSIKDYVLVACGHQSYDVLSKECDNVVHTLKDIEL